MKKIWMVIGLLVLVSASAKKSMKGRKIVFNHYAPPIGNVACIMPGGHNNGQVKENYNRFGGKVIFYGGYGENYRLDIHVSEQAVPPSETVEDLNKRLAHYFEKSAKPLLLKNHSGGQLIKSFPISDDNKQLYYGLFYYPSKRGGLSVAFEKVRAKYRALVIYYHQGFYYTVTNTTPNSVYSPDLDEYEDTESKMLESALSRFRACKFYNDIDTVTEIWPTATSKTNINVLVEDSNYQNEDTEFNIHWGDQVFKPKAFIDEALKWQVKNIYLPFSKESATACVLALAKEIDAKVFLGIEGTTDEFQQVVGNFDVTKSCSTSNN